MRKETLYSRGCGKLVVCSYPCWSGDVYELRFLKGDFKPRAAKWTLDTASGRSIKRVSTCIV